MTLQSYAFPEIVEQLPEAGLPIPGVKIFISHAGTHEVWFLKSEIDLDYPPHAHAAQWAVVLEGRIHIKMDGSSRTYEKGDQYYLPPGVEHSVRIEAGYAEVMFLDDPDFLGLQQKLKTADCSSC